ncbi:helix-turn-helix transcriptional regulator (plasmid) [Rhizobium beringeri]|uniref:helix-turn-helix domain-containing protein n=1 Tax=Rhizobium beringeri TaxID=3019934 RepID=UPI002DDD7E26|nr:helix-turn-helix transcriptional regulator [Rhizobium beringeri]WSG93526.1 helix-turn-helix transcriptional regulator [Rhizobium beringeri]
MAKEKGTPTRFSNYIFKKLMESSKSQKEIAEEAGYSNPNMITMLKLGHVKLALDRVPAMAKALNVDPLDLFKIALTQFYDEQAVRFLTEIIEGGISPSEKKILQIIRDASGNDTPQLTPERAKTLAEIFK